MSIRQFATPSAITNVMAKAVFKAARGLLRDFGEVEHLQISRKGPGNFVSTAQQRAENILCEELRKARPQFGFLKETDGKVLPALESEHSWVLSSLDGSINFLHGIPSFSLSVAVQKEQEILHACVYDPLRDEFFWAEKGMGAFLNDRKIRVSARRHMDEALLSTGVAPSVRGDHAEYGRLLEAVLPHVSGVRHYGAPALALAYVAAGRFDGAWEKKLSPGDMAAGVLLIREAGGMVSDFSKGEKMLEKGELIAANEHLYYSLCKILKRG